MKELIINYSNISPRRLVIMDKVQLIAAAAGIALGYYETWNKYEGISIIVPLTGFVIAFINILVVRFYGRLVNKYGNKFEIFLFRLNGIVLLITGISFQIFGAKYIQYVYYIIALFSFYIVPNFIIPAKKQKYYIHLSDTQIIVSRFFSKNIFSWNEISSFKNNNGILVLKNNRSKRAAKFYLNDNEVNIKALSSFLTKLKEDNNYIFEIEEN